MLVRPPCVTFVRIVTNSVTRRGKAMRFREGLEADEIDVAEMEGPELHQH